MDAPFEEGLWVKVLWVLLGLDRQVRRVLSCEWIWRGRGKEGGDFSEMCPKNPRRKEKNPCKAEKRTKQVWEDWVVFL